MTNKLLSDEAYKALLSPLSLEKFRTSDEERAKLLSDHLIKIKQEENNMLKYELSKYDFEALDKLMANEIGDRAKRPLTVIERVTIERLKERFAGGFTAWIETEE